MRQFIFDIRRHVRRPGLPLLLIVQAALAVAVLSLSFSVLQERIRTVTAATGLQETDLWLLEGRHTSAQAASEQEIEEIKRQLLALPGVVSVSRVNDLPLRNSGWRTAFWPHSNCDTATGTHVGIFLGDEFGFETLGLELIAGRPFHRAELKPVNSLGTLPPLALVSAALAEQLFGSTDVVGRTVHTQVVGEIRIIGVVKTLQASWPAWSNRELTVFMPAMLTTSQVHLALRMAPGQRLDTPKLSESLADFNISKIRRYSDIRQSAYAAQTYLIILLFGFVLAVLIVVATTAYALVSHWAYQRFHEIGVRRALGATAPQVFRLMLGEVSLFLLIGALLGEGLLVAGLIALEHSAAGIELADVAGFMISSLLVCATGLLAAVGMLKRGVAESPARAVKVY